MTTHFFTESLAKSHAAEDLPMWRECYIKFFPEMASMTNHRENGYWQKAGVDRSITLKNSKQILIDEKARYPNPKTGKSYEDIALEYLSNEERQTPGWVVKPLQADYIAYAILQLGKCYLLPVIQLQMAWIQNKSKWMNDPFFQIRAKNEGYVTVSAAVSPEILYPCIGHFLRCNFEPLKVSQP